MQALGLSGNALPSHSGLAELGPGGGALLADPLALLRLSLPNAGWRPIPRAWRSAASSLARVPFFVGSLRERFFWPA